MSSRLTTRTYSGGGAKSSKEIRLLNAILRHMCKSSHGHDIEIWPVNDNTSKQTLLKHLPYIDIDEFGNRVR